MAKVATKKRATKAVARQSKANAVAKAKNIAPDLPALIGSTPATPFRGNPDLFGRLVEDHDRHRALIAMIQESDAKSPVRKKLFLELNRETKAHAAAEEQALWSTVLRDPATTDDARHAVAEHKQIDDLLADLAARDMTAPSWLKRFEKLKEKYLHHIREEEQEQFVAAEKHLSSADINHLKGVFERRKRAEKASVKIKKKLKPSLY